MLFKFLFCTAPGDYGEEKRMIRLTIMNSLQCLTIRIINDTITENSENFMLLLSTTETRVKIAPATVTFNIIDDDRESIITLIIYMHACTVYCRI